MSDEKEVPLHDIIMAVGSEVKKGNKSLTKELVDAVQKAYGLKSGVEAACMITAYAIKNFPDKNQAAKTLTYFSNGCIKTYGFEVKDVFGDDADKYIGDVVDRVSKSKNEIEGFTHVYGLVNLAFNKAKIKSISSR